ncbi:MAG: ubiquinone biosynthesis protein UbiA, partial [Chloroflexota bacterium]
GLGAGLAYDLWLKRTPYSALAYAVALPLVPLWVWTALERFTPALLWAWPVGALLGGALHLANAVPDLEADATAGVHG